MCLTPKQRERDSWRSLFPPKVHSSLEVSLWKASPSHCSRKFITWSSHQRPSCQSFKSSFSFVNLNQQFFISKVLPSDSITSLDSHDATRRGTALFFPDIAGTVGCWSWFYPQTPHAEWTVILDWGILFVMERPPLSRIHLHISWPTCAISCIVWTVVV